MIKQDLAERMAGGYKKGDAVPKFVDPISLSIYLSIILSVVKIWKECRRKPEEIQLSCKNPTERDVVLLKKQIRRELGFLRNLREGKQVLNNTLQTASELTADEISELLNEENQNV